MSHSTSPEESSQSTCSEATNSTTSVRSNPTRKAQVRIVQVLKQRDASERQACSSNRKRRRTESNKEPSSTSRETQQNTPNVDVEHRNPLDPAAKRERKRQHTGSSLPDPNISSQSGSNNPDQNENGLTVSWNGKHYAAITIRNNPVEFKPARYPAWLANKIKLDVFSGEYHQQIEDGRHSIILGAAIETIEEKRASLEFDLETAQSEVTALQQCNSATLENWMVANAREETLRRLGISG